jgi:hypothetical protein
VRDQVSAQVRDQVRAQVRDQVSAQVRDQVSAQVRDQVRAQVRDQVHAEERPQKLEYFLNYFWGRCGAGWFAYFDYMLNVLKIKVTETVLNHHLIDREICESGFWWYAFKGLVICVETPREIHMRERRLHCDGGPAIRFADGFSIWCFNGVRVSKEIAETPAEKLDPALILEERNVEIRRELIRKIGLERFLRHTNHRVLDKAAVRIGGKRHQYELLEIELGEGVRRCPALKMEHASLPGVFLVEWVSRNCKTVQDALKFRNGTAILPSSLT